MNLRICFKNRACQILFAMMDRVAEDKKVTVLVVSSDSILFFKKRLLGKASRIEKRF